MLLTEEDIFEVVREQLASPEFRSSEFAIGALSYGFASADEVGPFRDRHLHLMHIAIGSTDSLQDAADVLADADPDWPYWIQLNAINREFRGALSRAVLGGAGLDLCWRAAEALAKEERAEDDLADAIARVHELAEKRAAARAETDGILAALPEVA